jgi:hypothetical protein
MSEQVVFLLIITGLIIIAGLSVFILNRYRQLKEHNIKRLKALKEQEHRIEEKKAHVLESLRVLSKALSEGQVGAVEGAIRIKTLLEYYDHTLLAQPKNKILLDVFYQTEHIPILDAWKSLDRSTRKKYLNVIEGIESKQGEEMKRVGQELYEHFNKC